MNGNFSARLGTPKLGKTAKPRAATRVGTVEGVEPYGCGPSSGYRGDGRSAPKISLCAAMYMGVAPVCMALLGSSPAFKSSCYVMIMLCCKRFIYNIIILADADPLRESWRGFRAGKRQSLEPLGYENGLSGTK